MTSDLQTYHAMTQFMFLEARLLDQRRYPEWLKLWDKSATYRVFLRSMRELAQPEVNIAIIDEDATMLAARVAQLSAPNLTKAENPPSLTRRLIGNIEITEQSSDGLVTVLSNIIATRVRGATSETTIYSAARSSQLRIAEGAVQLVTRDVILDQTVLQNGALTTLL